MSHRILVLVMLACGAGCSSSPKKADDPEKTVRAYADASEHDDAAAMERLIVPLDRIGKALDCPGIANPIAFTARAHETLAALAQSKGEPAGTGVAMQSMREVARATVERGGMFAGCTARETFEARSYALELRTPVAGPGDQTQQVIRLDGRWWILPIV